MDYDELFIQLTTLDIQRRKAEIAVSDLIRGTPYSEEQYYTCIRGRGLANPAMLRRLKKNFEQLRKDRNSD